MPREEDFAFWNKAKERRLMTQEQVEECVELLCALELVGSQQRSWDLAARKGYLTREQADELRSAPAGEPAAPPAQEEPESPPLEPFVPPSAAEGGEEAAGEETPPAGVPAAPEGAATPQEPAPPGVSEPPEPPALEPFKPISEGEAEGESTPPPPKRPGVGLIKLPGAEENDEDDEDEAVPEEEEAHLALPFEFADEEDEEAESAEEEQDEPAREAELQGYQIAVLRSGSAAAMHPVAGKPMSIGSDASNAIVLQAAEVSPRHARITVSGDKVTLWDMTDDQRMEVNGKMCSSATLGPCDLVQLGEGLLLYLPDYGDDPAPSLTTPVAAGGAPFAMLSVLEGPNAGAIFYVGQKPALVGKHKLAGVRIDAPGIDDFHAQLAAEPEGLVIADLGSREGVLVNNKPVTRAMLKTGDRLVLGPATVKVEILSDFAAGAGAAAAADAPSPPQQPEAPAPPPATHGARPEEESPFEMAFPAESEPEGEPAMPGKGVSDETRLSEADDAAEEDWTPELPSQRYGAGDLALTCIEGKSSGTAWKLDKQTMSLGRDRHADISVRDLSISRRHAALVITDQGVEARDLGSRNGIYVNGHRVRSALLKPGDTLRVGQCVFLVDLAEE